MRRLFFLLLRILSLDYLLLRNRPRRLYILMFHQVNNDPRTFYQAMPVAVFDQICRFVKKHFEIIHVSEVASHFAGSSRPAVIISFDDAHYDIVQNAYPILSELKLKFNVNVDTEILETGLPQDFVRVYDILNSSPMQRFRHPDLMDHEVVIDRVRPIDTENTFTAILSALSPADKRRFTLDMSRMAGGQVRYSRMMSADDVRALAGPQVEFGAHGHTHAILTTLSDTDLNRELLTPKQVLEGLTDMGVTILAYPNGISDDRVASAALHVGYRHLLRTEDRSNIVTSSTRSSYFRINQYHQSADEALAHIFGFHSLVHRLRTALGK